MMNRVKLTILCLVLLVTSVALADMGHKPTMDFQFKQATAAKLTAVSGQLMESQQADGSKAAPLGEYGPQRFHCYPTYCSALAYGFAPFHRLVIKFSDGKTRQSNVFPTAGIDSKYTVTIRDKDLLVEAVGKSSPAVPK